MRITSEVSERLRQATLRRAAQRRHRPCPKCLEVKILCSHCARMWCINCDKYCPWCPIIVSTPVTSSIPASENSGREQPINYSGKTTRKPRDRRAKDRRTHLPSIPVPGILVNWAAEVARLGYVLKYCEKSKVHKNHWDVQLLIPRNSGIPRVEWTTIIAGWKPSKNLGTDPHKQGLLQVLTIERDV